MAKENSNPAPVEETVADKQPETPATVSLDEYNKLYAQAIELENRYKRLFELYSSLVDKYLAGPGKSN